jgi:transformation/transcription domain-associated protein
MLPHPGLVCSESHPRHVHDLFVELSLTVPVRLSALLPHLHWLMRPLVAALKVRVRCQIFMIAC